MEKEFRERNKELSKARLLTAVGKVLKEEGFQQVKVNRIAKEADLDKKLIYRYFGNFENLVDEYLNSQNYWNILKDESFLESFKSDSIALNKIVLKNQFDFVSENEEFQKILLWQLIEEKSSLRALRDNQEEIGEVMFKTMFDDKFGDNAKLFRTANAILISGLYYINLYKNFNGSVFNGIGVRTEEGEALIKDAIDLLINGLYNQLEK